MLNAILFNIGFSETARRVYIHLVESGPSSARQLAENLNIPRPSVYDNVRLLIKNGLVVERDQENKKIFQMDDARNLAQMVQQKINILGQDKKKIDALLPTLAHHDQTIEPKIKFYSGVEGIKQVLRDMLWYENIETLTMWPISEMVEVLGVDYLSDLNKRRIKHNISIRGIWPKNQSVNLKDYPFLGVGRGHLRELRLSPAHMTWDMSYWLYADKVAFISSRQESFGFVIHSKDFVQLTKTQFEVIWKISKPIKAQPQYTNSFLRTL